MTKDLDKKAYWDWVQREIEEIYGKSPKVYNNETIEEALFDKDAHRISAFKEGMRDQLALLKKQNLFDDSLKLDDNVVWVISRSLGLSPRTVQYFFEKAKKIS